MKKVFICRIVAACSAFAAGLAVSDRIPLTVEGSLVSSAQAVIGRPATPGSAAGVARRTTRRTIARTSVYVAALPAGCSTVVVNGSLALPMRRRLLPVVRRALCRRECLLTTRRSVAVAFAARIQGAHRRCSEVLLGCDGRVIWAEWQL